MRQSLIAMIIISLMVAAELSAQPPGRGKIRGDGGADQKQFGPGGMQRGGQRGRGPGGPGGGGGPGAGGMSSRMLQMMPLFVALDRDGDGALSVAEIRNAPAALKRLDKNGNGIIDASELAPDRNRMGAGKGGPGGGPGKGRGPGQGGFGNGAQGPGGGGPRSFRGGLGKAGGSGATKPKRPGAGS